MGLQDRMKVLRVVVGTLNLSMSALLNTEMLLTFHGAYREESLMLL